MTLSVDSHLSFFHHLEEGCLCFCRSTVHLIHQYDISKDRSWVEVELTTLHIEYRCSQHIARHQVGCELHTTELGIHQLGHQTGQQCFGHARHTFYEHMTIGKDCRKQQVNRLLLSYHHLGDTLFQHPHLLCELGEVGS